MKRSVILQRAKDKKRKEKEREEELEDHYYANKNDTSPDPIEPLGDGGWWRRAIDMDNK